MKRITLFIALLCSVSAFPMRYLVQSGGAGAATWRASGEGETNVNLTTLGQSFDAWYNATVVANDEVWVAAGTYLLGSVITIDQANQLVCGGFSGTETSLAERSKVSGGLAWEFQNPTILDGNNAVQILTAATPFANVVFDGLTITKGNGANGGGALIRDGITLEKCILSNNVSAGNGGGINFISGGTLSNSHIVSNTALSGGGVYSGNTTAGIVAVVSNCLIEKNNATGTAPTGGGIRVQGIALTNVSNTVIRNNKCIATDGTTLKPGGAIYTNSVNNNFVNCLVVNNTGSNTVYFNGGNIINSTIANNVGQVYIASSSAVCRLINDIVWGNKTAADGVTNTGVTSNTTNTAAEVRYCGVSPALPAGWTQEANFTLEYGNDSQDLAKGPGFVAPTSFWGAAVNADQNTELTASNWSIKYTSGALNMGSVVPSITSDIIATVRPQGGAYDIGAFELPYFNTTVTFNAGGTVNSYTSGDVDSQPKGKQLAFTITPNVGKRIKSVLYNTVDVTTQLVNNVYTAPALTQTSALVVEFENDPGTALNNIQRKFECFAGKQGVELNGLTAGDQVTVFGVTGIKVKSVVASGANMSVALPSGVYVIKALGCVRKLIVR